MKKILWTEEERALTSRRKEEKESQKPREPSDRGSGKMGLGYKDGGGGRSSVIKVGPKSLEVSIPTAGWHSSHPHHPTIPTPRGRHDGKPPATPNERRLREVIQGSSPPHTALIEGVHTHAEHLLFYTL